MKTFLTSNEWQYRLLRTIVQGIIGVIIANIDVIVGYMILDVTQRTIVVGVVMALLSPIMKALGGEEDE